MINNISNKLMEKLHNYDKKNIVINQLGFIESRFVFQCMEHDIKNDILTIKDENVDIFIKINMNQIYNLETTENTILIYLDNDTQIKISK